MFFCDSYYYTFHLFRVKCRTLLKAMVFRAFSGFLQVIRPGKSGLVPAFPNGRLSVFSFLSALYRVNIIC